jgi:hypothetical protein
MNDILRGQKQLDRLPRRMCSSSISDLPSGCWTFHIHCFATTLISSALAADKTHKKQLGAQTKITMVMPSGTTVHKTSSPRLPKINGGRSFSDRRRYLIAKTTIEIEISSEKNAATASKK